MKIQIASDLHLEYKTDFRDLIIPCADILILAGDIGSFYDCNNLYDFFTFYCPKFTYIIYVIGNCEYYKSDFLNNTQNLEIKPMERLRSDFQIIEKLFTNLYVLDRSSIQIGNYLFTGCTLWSNLQKSLPIHFKIEDMTTNKYKSLHKKDLEFISKKCKFSQDNKLNHIVITHYVPLILKCEKTKTDLYMSDLSYIFQKNKINTWICGHLHKNFSLKYNNTLIVSNQKGKPGSFCQDYSKNFIINI